MSRIMAVMRLEENGPFTVVKTEQAWRGHSPYEVWFFGYSEMTTKEKNSAFQLAKGVPPTRVHYES